MSAPTADQIVEALAAKHANDVFVAECNLGSAWQSCRRIDAWAMPKSWSPLRFIGYEVKVSRGDFLRDAKWSEYLPICHDLYFACPAKLISPEELPADIGLMWAHGSRLITKRKAVRRTPDAARVVDLMSYVLMSRSRIVADMHQANGGTREARWRRWLEEGAKREELGRLVAGAVGRRLREAEAERRRAMDDVARFEAIEEALLRLGLTREAGRWMVEEKLSGADGHAAEIKRHAGAILRLAGGAA